ncbi:hypothetical protein [Sphingobacterium sp. CZ-2]|uniref:hypothetical protein n=1 Tax=Sphingobacterium sp. CZ-2 TaxID=2557994 RepID=UPI00106F0EDC|nr:hypothetical protein [Sphingobacterium sp. CZ-2]QBR13220.1 hypothetical protein E3D81_14010 [Sphingobacterium sp. CZ-2]
MLAAIIIYRNSYPYLFGEDHEDITINFGGKYLYDGRYNVQSHKPEVTKVLNQSYIEPIISKFDQSKSNLSAISCIVGNNGTGKSTLLKDILLDWRFFFILEDGDDYEILDLSEQSNYYDKKVIFPYHRVYYSPIMNYEKQDGLGKNSVDWSVSMQFVNDNHGDSEQLEYFIDRYQSEKFKRWILFNKFYNELKIDIVSFPFFSKVKVDLGRFEYTSFKTNYHNTPYQFREVFDLLFQKIKIEEKSIYTTYREKGKNMSDIDNNRVKFEYHFYEDILGKIITCLEYIGNRFLNEGFVPNDVVQSIKEKKFTDALFFFLEKSYLYEGNEKYYFDDLNNNLRELLNYFVPLIKRGDISKDDCTEMYLTYDEAYKLIEYYEIFNNSFLKQPFEYNSNPLFIFSPNINLSTGEQGILNLFSTLYHHAYCLKNKINSYDFHSSEPFKYVNNKILLLLDEGDMGFHPLWKKKYVLFLRIMAPIIYKGYEVQIILSTHDPIILSDFPKNNVVYLTKRNNNTVLINSNDKKSFAANVSDLLSDSFFIDNGLIGDWANFSITKFIDILKEKQLNSIDITDDEVIMFLKAIDEPIVKFKLAEMYSNYSKIKNVELQLIDHEIQQLVARRKELE